MKKNGSRGSLINISVISNLTEHALYSSPSDFPSSIGDILYSQREDKLSKENYGSQLIQYFILKCVSLLLFYW